MNYYDVGQTVRVRGTWSNNAGVAVDPDSGFMTFSYRAGEDGAITTYTWPTDAAIVREGVGKFHIDIPTTVDAVDYYYRWASTGTIRAAKEGVFHVNESKMD